MEVPPHLLQDLFQAYFDARRNKRNTNNQLQFELNYEKNIFALFSQLKDKSYSISKSICFIVFYPVKREIFAGDFRDRVIHHLVFNALNPLFEKLFIYDSYSCRKEKGPLFGIKRVQYFHRSCSRNYQKESFFLKLDIQGYFMSIDQKILFQKIQRAIQRKQIPYAEFWLWLLELIIFHDPTKNCVMKGHKKDWDGLPPSKSLFGTSCGTGLPIGNLTSQLFGNVYLNDFDHFIKSQMKCRYYGRYVDDFVILDNDKEFLKFLIPKIKTFLHENTRLILHPKKIHLQPCKNGIPFLGAIIKPYRTYVRNRTKGAFFKKIQYWENQMPLSSKEKQSCTSCLQSYLGLMKHFNTSRLQEKMIQRNMSPELRKIFHKNKPPIYDHI
ncbi:RNA-directed DNA polymerase [Candidatus Gracilibacteria bacterium]|nr:RNA-directed DNA polymerase [Candidatus Gracilibacteria bacterium]MCF7818970.1 RNA-directed DNA polymerase [Candidatus Gracilibacteria bacterium]